MKQYGRSGEEIAAILRSAEDAPGQDKDGNEVAPPLGVSRSTLRRWRRQFSGYSAQQISDVLKLAREKQALERERREALADVRALRRIAEGN